MEPTRPGWLLLLIVVFTWTLKSAHIAVDAVYDAVVVCPMLIGFTREFNCNQTSWWISMQM